MRFDHRFVFEISRRSALTAIFPFQSLFRLEVRWQHESNLRGYTTGAEFKLVSKCLDEFFKRFGLAVDEAEKYRTNSIKIILA